MRDFWADAYCRPRFGFAVNEWAKCFAWLPVVTFDGRLVWLRPVMRRRFHLHDYLNGGPEQWWVYATIRP